MGFVAGGVEDSHWRGGGQSLEGRRTATGGALGRGQSLEGRRTATGGAEDSDWNDRCPSGPPYCGGGQLRFIEHFDSNWGCLFRLCMWINKSPNFNILFTDSE